ncbi:MAG: tol-pal system YbgF family protein [Planctomycetota bacterium]
MTSFVTKFAARLTVCLAVTAAASTRVPAQQPTPPVAESAQAITARWRILRVRLDAQTTSPSVARAELEAFLRSTGGTHERLPATLEARLRLGSRLLTGFDPRAASTQFQRALAASPTDDVATRGHALCGLAQSLELLGDRDGAALIWKEAEERLAGSPWSDLATIAIDRLERTRDKRVKVGQPIPDAGAMLDHLGTARRVTDLRGGVALLLFASAADSDSLDSIGKIVSRAREAGLDDDRMMLFLIETQGRDLVALARTRGWRMPMIAPVDGFLGAAFLAGEVRSVPAHLLLDARGRLLARNLPPHRIGETIGTARR